MNKRVLVTGSSRGIGKAIALELASLGFSLTLHGRTNSDSLEQALKEVRKFDESADSLTFDLLERDKVREILNENIKTKGAFYGVVLCAGIAIDHPFPGMDYESWSKVIQLGLDSFHTILHPVILPMIQLRTGGRIVVISSISGVHGNRGQTNYSAAKAGLIGAAKALSKELAKRRISVNCIAPGAIETDMISPELKAEMLESIPMKRLGRVEEVAAAAGYLFSPRAEYMTGQTLILSGGLG